MNKCRDFDLAPLESFPRDLFKNDRMAVCHGFIISMAVAVNDLKSVLWSMAQLEHGNPGETKVDPYCGQWIGMAQRNSRLAYSIFYEVLENLTEHREFLTYKTFTDAVSKIPDESKKHWDALINVLNGKDDSKSLEGRIVGFIRSIRNSIGFHYYGHDNFYAGYKAWLDTQGPASAAIYVSLGKNLEGSRFYFADAVCEQFHGKLLKDKGLTEKEVFDYIRSINYAFRFIIEKYMRNLLEEAQAASKAQP